LVDEASVELVERAQRDGGSEVQGRGRRARGVAARGVEALPPLVVVLVGVALAGEGRADARVVGDAPQEPARPIGRGLERDAGRLRAPGRGVIHCSSFTWAKRASRRTTRPYQAIGTTATRPITP